jgi:hypothetical protein
LPYAIKKLETEQRKSESKDERKFEVKTFLKWGIMISDQII